MSWWLSTIVAAVRVALDLPSAWAWPATLAWAGGLLLLAVWRPRSVRVAPVAPVAPAVGPWNGRRFVRDGLLVWLAPPFAILLWAAAFRARAERVTGRTPWYALVPGLLLGLQLLLSAGLVVRARQTGHRRVSPLVAALVSVVVLPLSWFCWFVARMIIANDWL